MFTKQMAKKINERKYLAGLMRSEVFLHFISLIYTKIKVRTVKVRQTVVNRLSTTDSTKEDFNSESSHWKIYE